VCEYVRAPTWLWVVATPVGGWLPTRSPFDGDCVFGGQKRFMRLLVIIYGLHILRISHFSFVIAIAIFARVISWRNEIV